MQQNSVKHTDELVSGLRFGLFVHYGLFSLLGRGEWVMNRERIPIEEYQALAGMFTADRFDAGALCDLAVSCGMRYLVFTTMHHEGFRLYNSQLSGFNSHATASGRDLVRECVDAARDRGLKVGLYHSLNNWADQPDAVAALESPAAYERFIARTFDRIRELVQLFNPIDILWYDGWWPFNAERWQAQRMNRMVREIQPDILFNGRNGLPGDFATPEQHLTAPNPWRPWEACMTLNNSWAYQPFDTDYKSPGELVDALITTANRRGNLLLNVGLKGDGAIAATDAALLQQLAGWMSRCGEAVMDTDPFDFDLQQRGDHRSEWTHAGNYTAKGNRLYLLVRRWPGKKLVIAGLNNKVLDVTLLPDTLVKFTQEADRLIIEGLPDAPPDAVCPVLRMTTDGPPEMYLTGGMRVPRVAHPPYDPCPSDIAH